MNKLQLKFDLNDYVEKAVTLLPQILAFVTRDDQFQCKDLELTVSQLRFLKAVNDLGEAGMRSISDALSIAPPSATMTADGLVSAGLISRRDDPSDRRVVLVTLTPKGKNLMRRFLDAKRSRWREIMESLSESDRKTLISTLKQILSLLEKTEKVSAR